MYKTDIINILYERNEKNDKYFTDDFDLGCYYCFYVFLPDKT